MATTNDAAEAIRRAMPTRRIGLDRIVHDAKHKSGIFAGAAP